MDRTVPRVTRRRRVEIASGKSMAIGRTWLLAATALLWAIDQSIVTHAAAPEPHAAAQKRRAEAKTACFDSVAATTQSAADCPKCQRTSSQAKRPCESGRHEKLRFYRPTKGFRWRRVHSKINARRATVLPLALNRVDRAGIEPATPGFSVLCSTD